ncbi:PTS IIA-like nitrogen-regulatory protein PtsN [Saccharobesus litoralis]|uniref:PTS IIA-like nitrogen-regulatory protein PtsN n=1 Tax=Saccharobesus litoralis TaxID=2172099 RepID=A0A2S0VWU4_9ALTE|nr:PTS IIA-like nitrogen regulatory protein PtsN [Saccharobesus litoralis]AWB68653.1 PTS IIA-like nitrogen-regulatory protein PtsN [Saccharobesus litoralis]
MEIEQLITPDCVFCAVPAKSKKRILQVISQYAAKQLGQTEIQEQDILDALLAREKLGSTGIGQGIALPHGRLNCNKSLALLLTSDEAIDYDAIDNAPVKVFFALLAPESECQDHLKSLALIAEKLSDKTVLKSVKNAITNQELYQAITN